MSHTDDLKRFMADLEASEGLRKSLDDALKRIAGAGTVASDGEALAAAAAELGYDVSVADLERAFAEDEDLDDADLEGLAGGKHDGQDEHGHDEWCLTAWHCLATTLHTDSKDTEAACWSNYSCLCVNNNPAVRL